MKLLSLTTQSIFSSISHFLVKLKHKENSSQFNETEFLNERKSSSRQADVNRRIKQVQDNYFLERRTFL